MTQTQLRARRPVFTALLVSLVAALLAVAAPSPARADDAALKAAMTGLLERDFAVKGRAVDAIVASGAPQAADILTAMRAGALHFRKSDRAFFITEKAERRSLTLIDPFTGARGETVKSRSMKKVTVNNALRVRIDAALGALTLLAPDPATRAAAAEKVFKSRDAGALPALEAALAAEADIRVAALMADARAAILIADASQPLDARLAAVERIREKGDREALGLLGGAPVEDAPEAFAAAVETARAAIARNLELWGYAQNVWQGISLGSVLLLAAIGLAITFGVMGVINMAHGELVMLGAYTTFAVQEVIRGAAPELFGWSLLIAAPLAFLVSGGVGVAMERGVVRHLYGRPLETLLATWGVSLILQQAVRSIFGPNNREVGNPDWMSGAFELGQLTITYNRLWILLFALAVFAVLLLILKRTPMGLEMRAVTQNRAMAADMGVRTGWVDAMTFGLGAGVAGLAGVALSQIDNVSPNLGQSYIVDSFMVVVFGGAGNLFGALAGAFTLGIANKFLEPFAGAVLAKILVLVFIILFIQKRPRGLFAIRGRAVES